MAGIIRKSIVAGSFYPADPGDLQELINEFLEKAETSDIGNIKALISPHAGYVYSGQVAAYSYKQVAGQRYDSVIIIAPSHAEYFDFISIYGGDGYRTPLGVVAVDCERSKKLEGESRLIKRSDYGHGREHSLEVQLPFLQMVLEGSFKIVPVVIGSQNRESIIELGKSIGRVFSGENILIVASTDLSHYHPYNEAVSLDKNVIDMIASFDSGRLLEALANNTAEMCGGGPVASAMIASGMLGADSARILHYANSGDASGDRSAVVGYVSAAFYKK
jgi:MEMO1 family protein